MSVNSSDVPAYNPYAGAGGKNSIPPVNPVDDPNLSPQEATAQAALYLGYLASLANGYTDANPEIKRIYGIIKKYLDEGKIQGPMKPIIEKMLGIVAPGGKITTGSLEQYAAAFMGPNGPAMAIYKWITNGGFSFSDATSPDTVFAYIMFMNAAGSKNMDNPELVKDVEKTLNQKSPSGFPTFMEYISEFLVVYLRLHEYIFGPMQACIHDSGVDNAALYTTFEGRGPYSKVGWKPSYPGEPLPDILEAYLHSLLPYLSGNSSSEKGKKSFIELLKGMETNPIIKRK